MFINAEGSVGIGTTNPSRGQLSVYGVGQLTSALTDVGETTGNINIASSSNAFGAGGAVSFSALNDNGTTVPQYAIKSLLINGVQNGVGALAFCGRRAGNATQTTYTVY